MPKRFTESDCGCWIDGALGFEHAVERIHAELTAIYEEQSETKHLSKSEKLSRWLLGELCTELEWSIARGHNGDQTDAQSEMLDEATEILQEHTEDGLVWIWDSGDLILTAADQVD